MPDDNSTLSERQKRVIDELDDIIKSSFAQIIEYLNEAGTMLRIFQRHCHSGTGSSEEVAEAHRSVLRLERMIDIIQQHAMPELIQQMDLVKRLRESQAKFLAATGSIRSGS